MNGFFYNLALPCFSLLWLALMFYCIRGARNAVRKDEARYQLSALEQWYDKTYDQEAPS